MSFGLSFLSVFPVLFRNLVIILITFPVKSSFLLCDCFPFLKSLRGVYLSSFSCIYDLHSFPPVQDPCVNFPVSFPALLVYLNVLMNDPVSFSVTEVCRLD